MRSGENKGNITVNWPQIKADQTESGSKTTKISFNRDEQDKQDETQRTNPENLIVIKPKEIAFEFIPLIPFIPVNCL